MKDIFKYIIIATAGLILSLNFPALPQVIDQQPIQSHDIDLLQVAERHYHATEFREAAQAWQQAAQAYEATGDVLKQAQILSLISLAYQKQGQWQEAERSIELSLSLLETLPEVSKAVSAQVLNNQGLLQLAMGRPEEALKSWEQATENYQEIGDQEGVTGSLLNQAKALEALGIYRRSYKKILQALGCNAAECAQLNEDKKLAQIQKTFQEKPDSTLKATGLRSLGNALRVTGNFTQSEEILRESLHVAQRLGQRKQPSFLEELSQEQSQALLSLGNTERALASRAKNTKDIKTANNYLQKALINYQKAAATATSPITKIQAQLNKLSLLIDAEQSNYIQAFLPQIEQVLRQLPLGRASIYARVNLARSLMLMSKKDDINAPSSSVIAQILQTAVGQAETIEDRRSQSYALGTFGELYEQTKEWSKAKEFTRKALALARAIKAPDIDYQWQWQLGRLLKHEDIKQAIAAYTEAVNSLQTLRGDLVALNPDIQFDFREQVEPVYRQTVDLLLKSADLSLEAGELTENQARLKKAREVIELLQIAELDNFFRDACVQQEEANIDNIVDQSETPTAVLYSIVLADRLEVILKLPRKTDLLHYYTKVDQNTVDSTIEVMQEELSKPIPSQKLQNLSRQVYDWLLRPAEQNLTDSGVTTLVFVLDYSLQNIPLAVLDDGEKYLVEKYATALSPGLKLLKPEPLVKKNQNILVAGVSERVKVENRVFGSLVNVPFELEEIKFQAPVSKELLNSEFNETNFKEQIKSAPFSVIHIATHGNFSSNPEDTFILLWNQLLKVNDLDNLLRISNTRNLNPLGLLTLSACQTATGDKRAALGLAGVAVRAGARSTLASLWQVEDASTADLMIRFYQELGNNRELTKAAALQRAQIYLLKEHSNSNYRLPYYWAPFVLVGDWL
ncbi:CHAT domain-containing protein [Lyngbya aestuarii]|uniref:CHAT domain-containing protein n=1 Tax=Lyngbya aestuarii TaxID=118322 RepID=UPI00403DC5F6